METTESLLTYLNDLFIEEIESVGYRVYPVDAPPDTPKPYIVNQITFNQSEFPMDTGLLIVHIWGKTAAEALGIKSIIYKLLQYKNIHTSEILNCQSWFFSDGFIPDEPGIWHYVIQFNLRLFKSAELRDVIERDTS
mgnify:FL=1|jgi:hypothetical protein